MPLIEMAKNIFNWTFSDIAAFLRKHGFVYSYARGSHYYYTANSNDQERIVQVPFHGSKNLKPKSFKAIVVQSGIPLNVWLEE